jgi:glycine/D-amino acid oxidase-like deaminating enzyme
MKRLASARYRGVITRDGAPLVGRLRRTKTVVVAGLGSAGAFLAPLLARLVADAPEPDEKRWAAAHHPARPRAPVADFAPMPEVES